MRAAHAYALRDGAVMLENPRLEMAVQSALGFHDEIAYEAEYTGLAFDRTARASVWRERSARNPC